MNTQEKFIMSALADELEKLLDGDAIGDERSTINIARMLVKESSIEERLNCLTSSTTGVNLHVCSDGFFELDIDYLNGDTEQFCDKSLEQAIFKAEQDIAFGNHFMRL